MEEIIWILLIVGIIYILAKYTWVFWCLVGVGTVFVVWYNLPEQRRRRKAEAAAKAKEGEEDEARCQKLRDQIFELFKANPAIDVNSLPERSSRLIDLDCRAQDGEKLSAEDQAYLERGEGWHKLSLGGEVYTGRTAESLGRFGIACWNIDDPDHLHVESDLHECLADLIKLKEKIRELKQKRAAAEEFKKQLTKMPTSTRPHILGYRILKQLRMVRVDDCESDDEADIRLREEAHKAGGNGIINMKVRPYPGGRFSAEGDAVETVTDRA